MTRMKCGLVAVVVLFQVSGMAAQKLKNSGGSPDLPRFYEVTKAKIYRGAQPTDVGFSELQAMGIRTVLDLRDEDANQIAGEGTSVESLGMNFISVPLSGFFAPSETNMNRIQSILTDKSLQPVFVHCQHGQDRTGLAVGLYRVFSQHVPPAAAKKEMLSLGFHEILLGLNEYFHEHTESDENLAPDEGGEGI